MKCRAAWAGQASGGLEITPASTLAVLQLEKDYLKALVMAFRLNEAGLIQRVFQAIPFLIHCPQDEAQRINYSRLPRVILSH